MSVWGIIKGVLEGTGESLNAHPSKPDAFTVIHYLMQIDKPPMDGAEWLDGYNDGIYVAQCHLKGAAQGAAMNGRYEEAVVLAKQAVSLNDLRNHNTEEDDADDVSSDPVE